LHFDKTSIVATLLERFDSVFTKYITKCQISS
jgi:hypothetical protein